MNPLSRRFLAPVFVLVVLLAAVGIGLTLRGQRGAPLAASGGAQLSDAEVTWCTSSAPAGPKSLVDGTGMTWVGLADYAEEDYAAEREDPRWVPACRLAYQLYSLSDEQWAWCWQDEVRNGYLAPAIDYLGLGIEEAAGRGTFAEAPGDNPAEYVQACRFAFTYWRDAPVGSDPGTAFDAFVDVAPADEAWCTSHTAQLTDAAAQLEITQPMSGSSLVARVGRARACRFAYVVDLAAQLPPSTHVASQRPDGPKITYEALVTNRRTTPVLLVDVANGEHGEQVAPACAWVRINPVSRELPWSLGYRLDLADTSDALPLRSAGSSADGTHLAFQVTFEADGSVSVVNGLPDSPTVSDSVC